MNRLDVKRVQVRAELEGSLAADGPLEVSQFMTAAPDCISADATAMDLIKKFHQKEFRHLLVTDDDGRLVGVISDRDVIRCLGPTSAPRRTTLAETRAHELMSTDLITVRPNTPLTKAVSLMVDHGISCLPVLADEKLVGILTNTDLYLVLEALLQTSTAVVAD